MSSNLLCVSDQLDTADALRMMRDGGDRRVPVIDRQGSLVGILAVDDFLEYIAVERGSFSGTVESERDRDVKCHWQAASTLNETANIAVTGKPYGH